MSEEKGPKISVGRDKAIALYESKWWIGKSAKEIVDIQLFTSELCMDFGDFQAAMQECLDRPVFTHEFGLNYDGLVEEYLGERDAPTFDEIISLIPTDKLIMVQA